MKNSRLNYTLYGLIYAALFAFMGVFNLAFAQWDTSVILTPEYWITTASSTMLYILAFTNTVGLSVDIKKANDPTHKEMEETINTLSRKVVAHNFREYIDGFNWKTKKQTWKEVYENKYTIFNNNLPYRLHIEVKELPQDKWKWRTKRLMRKKAKLEQFINDAWIDENVKYIKFRYPFITPQEVRTGEVTPVSKKRLLAGNVLLKSVRRRLGFVMIGVTFNAFLSALAWTGSPFNINVILQVLLQLLILLLNVGYGFKEGELQFKEVILNNLYTREDILVDYLQTKGANELVKKQQLIETQN